MLRTLIPAISAASIHVSFFAIAFKITSCSFIIRSVSRTGITWLSSTPPASTFRTDRTTHVLIGPDNSHANDIGERARLTPGSSSDITEDVYERRRGLLSAAVAGRPAHSAVARGRRTPRVCHHAGGRPPIRRPVQTRSRNPVRQFAKTAEPGPGRRVVPPPRR